jgi:hypothetical protein
MMTLLELCVVSLPVACLAGWIVWLDHQRTKAWMSIFCGERGIHPITMEPSRLNGDEPLSKARPDTRKRVSVPVIGAGMWAPKPKEQSREA